MHARPGRRAQLVDQQRLHVVVDQAVVEEPILRRRHLPCMAQPPQIAICEVDAAFGLLVRVDEEQFAAILQPFGLDPAATAPLELRILQCGQVIIVVRAELDRHRLRSLSWCVHLSLAPTWRRRQRGRSRR